MKQKMHALIIEDEDEVIQSLSKKLKSLRHTYTIAKNQEEANLRIENHSFDYVLLDLKLPVDSEDINPDSTVGSNLLHQIREKYSEERLPIIVMTAYEKTTSSVVEVMKKGANDFIEKPFQSGKLEEKIQEILHVRQSEMILCLQELSPNRKFKNYYAELVIFPGKKDIEKPCKLGSVMLRFFYTTMNATLQGQIGIDDNKLKTDLKYDDSEDHYWFNKRIDYIKKWVIKNKLSDYFEFNPPKGISSLKVRTTLSKEQICVNIPDYEKAKAETKV